MDRQPLPGRPASGPHLIQLDGLRALAVMCVAWHHWAPHKYMFGLPWGTGVQLFYVLSGFLITGILLDASPHGAIADLSMRLGVWRSFYARRFLRIFPLFYATLAVTLFFGVASIANTWPWHAAYLSNFFFYQQGNWGIPPDPFRHFWSLAVEEQFYLVWPFLILLLPRRSLWKTLAFMIVLAPLLRIVLPWAGENARMVHALPWCCLDALGIGSLLAYTRRYSMAAGLPAGTLSRFCLAVGLPGAVLAGAAQAAHLDNFVIASLGHFSIVLFYAAVVYRAADGFGGALGSLLHSRPLVYLGKISYGVYVIHNFAPLATSAIATRAGWHAGLAASLPLQLVANSAFTVTLAVVSWHCFELPLNNLKRFFPYARTVVAPSQVAPSV